MLALVLLAGAPGAGPLAGKDEKPPAAPPDSPAAPDTAEVFVPLARRPAPAGAFIAALAASPRGLWAVGDSGLIAFSSDDSLFRRLDPPDRLPLRCARWWDEALVCAGDSGRVFRVTEGKARRAALRDRRAVLDLAGLGDAGLLGGEEGLLARSRDGGRSWDTLAAPLPMRFSAVLCRPEAWWAGGAGGRLFTSTDEGGTWRALESLPSAVADLATGPGATTAALDREGRIFLLEADGRRELGRAAVGRARSLAAVAGGWAVGGEGGRVALLDTLTGQWRAGRLPQPTVLDALAARDGDLLMAGAWGTLAVWRAGDEAPRPLRHSLTRYVEAAPAAAAGDALAALADSLAVPAAHPDSVAAAGPRYFQNVVDTDTRCTTPPTRMRQLERSYDQTRWLGVTGRAMLAVDVGADGKLDSLFLLEEWPAGVGVGRQALQLGAALTFTPGFRKSGMVRSRMLLPVLFSGSESDYLSWAAGRGAGGGLLDSLLADMPRAFTQLPPKALVKAMGFPRKAKRFVWEGEAVVEYALAGDSISRGRVLWESEAKYGFGAHALEILPRLHMALPEGVGLAPGDHLRVAQRFRFDRKRYRRAAREAEEGFRFTEVLLSVVEADSARYQPGLSQLEWLLNDFQGQATLADWPEMDLTVVLRHDGRVHDFRAVPRPGGSRQVDEEALRGLAVLFTWGHPRATTEDKADTLAFTWKPAAFRADSLNQPPALRALLHGVVY